MKKNCKKCQKTKSKTEFHKDKSRPDGLAFYCKVCIHNYQVRRNAKPEVKRKVRLYQKENEDKYRIYKRNWQRRNSRKDYFRKKRETDPNYKLITNIRTRLNKALRVNYKSGSAVETLGCSVEYLKQHLESQFKPGMTWKNYGSEWHIDHIKPLSSFDLENSEDFNKACHYKNLQPLWKEENLKKSNKR